jgi:hypothetical protein
MFNTLKKSQVFLLTAGAVLLVCLLAYPVSICTYVDNLTRKAIGCQSLFWGLQVLFAIGFYLIGVFLVIPVLRRPLTETQVARYKHNPIDLYNEIIFQRGLFGTVPSIGLHAPILLQVDQSTDLIGADVYRTHSQLTNKKNVLLSMLAIVVVQFCLAIEGQRTPQRETLMLFVVMHCAGFLIYEEILFFVSSSMKSRL